MKFFNAISRRLWGNVSGFELIKFLYLAAGSFCLIGAFWPLKPLKQSIFVNMVGSDYVPTVRMISVLFVFAIVLLYSKIVDHFSKQRLIYAFLTFFVSVGGFLVYCLMHPQYGLANTDVGPHRWVAWAFVLFTESYITVMQSLFWSFVNDITSSSSAKKGYGLIVFGSQSGALVFAAAGKYFLSDTSTHITRIPQLILLSLGLFLVLGAIVWLLTHTLPKEHLQSTSTDEKPVKQVGVLEGLFVVLSRPYVAGMFCLPFLQEMVSALIDFQQAYLAEVSYAEQGLRTNYFFSVSLWLQIISCSFALLGTSYVHRKIGTTYSLMAYPLLLLGAAGFYWVNPTLQAVTLFIVMLKAFHYAFNQPVRETLYIPTSRDIKYKARAWIDMIGMRGAKMAGARVAGFIGHVPAVVGSVAIGLLGVWVAMARFVGRYNERAVRDGIVVK